jgi:undecaprenyl-diphosphatase
MGEAALESAGWLLGVPSLWDLDLSLFRHIHRGWHRDWLDPIFFVISCSGLGWVQAIVILAVPAWGRVWYRGRKRLSAAHRRPALLRLLLALAISGLISSGILKRALARDRPSNLADAIPQESVFYHSFPSGHAATSFAIATSLLFLTWRTPKAWIGFLALGWACLVGLSRVYRGVHWPTDVLSGALIGVGSAAIVAALVAGRSEVSERGER